MSAFRYCLNTSTLRGHQLSPVEEAGIASAAGYESIEPWVDELEKLDASPGGLRDWAERARDLGLAVESGIGFFEWIVDDPDRRKAGLEEARRSMDLVARAGGSRIAAPAFGATTEPLADLNAAAERYAELLRLGRELGVRPLLELWGFSKALCRLGEVCYVAMECGDPSALLLLDVYHIYKGGSPLSGLGMLNGSAIGLFHVNDYPAAPAREDIDDADRVFPGDGIAPLRAIRETLVEIGYSGALSLELFNKEYYSRDPRAVAAEGLEKMRRAFGP